MRNFGQLQTSTGKSKKLKFDRLPLSKKYIASVKTYTEDLTFNYLCENPPNYLCHYIIFHDATPLYFFQLKHYILSAKVVQVFRLSAAWVKVHQILMSFFKPKDSFSSKFGSLFSVMRDNSSVLFQLKLYMLLTKVAHQSANFQTCHCSH